MKFISTRCANVNRGSSLESQPKKQKLATLSGASKHQYRDIPPCDAVSHERNMMKIAKELKKTTPTSDVLIDTMQQTFPNRRQWILNETHSVFSICEKYVLLKSPRYVSTIFTVKQTLCK